MRKYLLTGLMALAPAAAAHAAAPPTIIFTQGNTALNPAFSTATIGENFERAAGGGAQYTAAQGQGVFNESVSGNLRTFNGNVPPVGVNPDNNSDRYLAVEGGGVFTLNFAGAGFQFLSFVLGSLDSYNSLTLGFADNTFQTFTGAGIVNTAVTFDGNGNSSTAGTNGVFGRVNYFANGGSGITSAAFSSTNSAFEIDDIAAAVPEPGTWALMILGFGLVGSQLRARKRRTTVSFA